MSKDACATEISDSDSVNWVNGVCWLAARYHEAIKKREQYVNYIFKGRFSLDFV